MLPEVRVLKVIQCNVEGMVDGSINAAQVKGSICTTTDPFVYKLCERTGDGRDINKHGSGKSL